MEQLTRSLASIFVSSTAKTDGPGIYAYRIRGIKCDGGIIAKVGMSNTSVLKRINDEKKNMATWRTKCYPEPLFLKIGTEFVGRERIERENLGMPLKIVDLEKSAPTIIKLSELNDFPVYKNHKLKVAKGWDTWLRSDGKQTNVGPSEFVFVPQHTYESLLKKEHTHKNTFSGSVTINFENGSVGPLTFVKQ